MSSESSMTIEDHSISLAEKYANKPYGPWVANYVLMGTVMLDFDPDDPTRPDPDLAGLRTAAYMYGGSPEMAEAMLGDEELTADIIEISFPKRGALEES